MMDKIETFDQLTDWYLKAKPGQKTIYYKGYYIEDSVGDFKMRKFSDEMTKFEKKTRAICLYQKKISAGSESKQPVYEYYVEKIK